MASTLRHTLARVFRNLHVFLYRRSGGKIAGSIFGFPVLLLTVTGRKSGQTHTTPLAYLRHDGEYLISASAAGADKNPSWFLNLASRPEATIEMNGRTYPVKATITTGAERDRLYELFKAQ